MLFLIVAMLIGAALELMGVGLIYEAASVIMDPDILESSATLAKVYDHFSYGKYDSVFHADYGRFDWCICAEERLPFFPE